MNFISCHSYPMHDESQISQFKADINFAKNLDQNDPLKNFREEFHFPLNSRNEKALYFAGHSLGLQPKKTQEYIQQELNDWAKFGVEGHFHAKNPWLPYHEFVTAMTARLVGADPLEVVMMNTLTVNLHLMMISFYRPTKTRYKIMIEAGAFPSDQYAVQSQIHLHQQLHQKSIDEALIELKPREGERTLRESDILEHIEKEGDSIALIMLGNANYLTGQAFNIKEITQLGHKKGCFVGFDLAHGAGNLLLNLHDQGPDFAVWCSYKYLNSGPGSLAGCFVHSRHAYDFSGPRLHGWWGQKKETRFKMEKKFEPLPGVEAWQLSNPPIFQLAAIRASFELFDQATMPALVKKGHLMTKYFEFLISDLKDFEFVTPKNLNERGNLICLRVAENAKSRMEKLVANGVFCDFREPDILRFTPIPLYNNFSDVYHLAQILRQK